MRIRKVLEAITASDKLDALALQQRKLSIDREIKAASTAVTVNRKYAAAAYGKPAPQDGCDAMSVVEEHPVDPAKKIEDLGRIIIAYSEVTEKLEASHKKLESTVKQLSAELSEKNRQFGASQASGGAGRNGRWPGA